MVISFFVSFVFILFRQSFGKLSPKYRFVPSKDNSNEIECTVTSLTESTPKSEQEHKKDAPFDVSVENDGNISVTPMNVRYGVIQTKSESEIEERWVRKLNELCNDLNERKDENIDKID